MKITKEIRRIALFMAFGDGCIEKYGNLTIKHCIAQKEYLLYKYKLIKVLCNHAPIEITNNNFKAFKLNTKCFDFLKLYTRVLYPNNKKTLNRIFNHKKVLELESKIEKLTKENNVSTEEYIYGGVNK